MIKSFADKKTKKIFDGEAVKKIDTNLQKQALRRLMYLQAANTISDLTVPPSNRLEKLSGNLKEFYSIRVNDQWRIIFMWDEKTGSATEVEFTDYHP